MISYELLILDVVKYAQICMPMVIYFVFWYFGITTMKNHLSEHFES
jgi:hypothetical protein